VTTPSRGVFGGGLTRPPCQTPLTPVINGDFRARQPAGGAGTTPLITGFLSGAAPRVSAVTEPQVVLREVRREDLRVLHEHQADPVAAELADFPSRGWDAFEAHWLRILDSPTGRQRVVEVDGEVAGNVVVWDGDGGRELGYWIGRSFWGTGVASAAVGLVLAEEPVRPLHAHVALGNAPSRRVLEKHGFVLAATHPDGHDLVLA
jgi:RimJ/RimL family protein N-acetyltransferase